MGTSSNIYIDLQQIKKLDFKTYDYFIYEYSGNFFNKFLQFLRIRKKKKIKQYVTCFKLPTITIDLED